MSTNDLTYLKSIGAVIVYTSSLNYEYNVASTDEQIALAQRGIDRTLTIDDARTILNERDSLDRHFHFGSQEVNGKLIRVVNLKFKDKYTDFIQDPTGPCPKCKHTDPLCRLCLGKPIAMEIECTCTCECPDCLSD